MTSLKRAFFPVEPRYLPGNRWLNVGLRTLHLVGIAGIGGDYFYVSQDDTWRMPCWPCCSSTPTASGCCSCADLYPAQVGALLRNFLVARPCYSASVSDPGSFGLDRPRSGEGALLLPLLPAPRRQSSGVTSVNARRTRPCGTICWPHPCPSSRRVLPRKSWPRSSGSPRDPAPRPS